MSRLSLASRFAVILACLAMPVPGQAQEDLLDQPSPPPAAYAPPPAPAIAATDLQMRINALETQLRNMNGEVERLQYQNNQLQQNMQRMNADYEGRFQLMEKRLGAQEVRAAPMPAPPPPLPASPPLSTQGAVDQPQSAPASNQVLGTLGGKGGDAQALYDQAFQSLRQAKYDEAEALFHEFLKEHPKHRLAENAKYWLGETYYVRGKFQDAAATFGEDFQQFPTGNKAPDNLLKLAMSLGSINKKQDACTTLAELKKRFPNASAIIRNRADQEKKSLACT